MNFLTRRELMETVSLKVKPSQSQLILNLANSQHFNNKIG